MTATAARVLVQTLALHGVDRIFCVPGESYLAVMDSLYDDPVLRIITCRHEAGAGFMALADAKATGRTGVCFASRGPGATNAAIAVHTAQQDAVPLILLLGQIGRDKIGRRAFQEVDYRKTFSDMAKWVEEVHIPERVPEVVARAFHMAESGTPGPVVISLPTDLLSELTDAEPASRRPRPRAMPADADVAAAAEQLAAAERPLVIAGGQVRNPESRRLLLACSETWAVPVMATFENQDVFSNDHPHYGGVLGIRPPAAIKAAALEADLVLAIGTRLPDMATQGYTIPGPSQRLIQIYPDAAQIGSVIAADLGIVAEAAPFLEALAARNAPTPPAGRAAWIGRVHGAYAESARLRPRPAADGIDFGHVIQAMIEQVPDDAIITSDAGGFASWLHRHYPFKSSQLMLGTEAGAMGIGVPAAVAAALRFPERQVLALVGDGGALMTGYELATAVMEKARVRVIVSNNASYGTIRFHQETRYPGRPLATDLARPDFALLARALGAKGLTIAAAEEAGPVLREALATDGPVVIDVRSSLELINANTTISALRAR